jgi:hypothetical protein
MHRVPEENNFLYVSRMRYSSSLVDLSYALSIIALLGSSNILIRPILRLNLAQFYLVSWPAIVVDLARASAT